jgi:hypothetical protein
MFQTEGRAKQVEMGKVNDCWEGENVILKKRSTDMTYSVRFDRLEDLEHIASVDPAVPKHILRWKLQNEEIIVAEDNHDRVGYLRLDVCPGTQREVMAIARDPDPSVQLPRS